MAPRALVAALLACSHALAFQPTSCVRPRVRRHALRMNEDDDEVAALEKRLAELKGKKDAEEAAAEGIKGTPVELKRGFDPTTLSNRRKVATEQGEVLEELLSEAWKDEAAAAGGGGLPIVQVAGGALLVLALIAFAQVPIGQDDVAPVTYGGASTPIETPAQIKARYEAGGEDAE